MISSQQISAARALLGWTESDLAQKSRVSVTMIKRMEKHGTASIDAIFTEAIQKALKAAGVEFVKETGEVKKRTV